MRTRGQLVAAVGAGYLLGRRTAKLADIPEVAMLVESIRGELMTAAKDAAVTAVNSRIDSLNRRLESGAADPAAGTGRRSDEVRNLHVVEAEESEEERRARRGRTETGRNRNGKTESYSRTKGRSRTREIRDRRT